MFSFFAKSSSVGTSLRYLSTRAHFASDSVRAPDSAKCINKVILLGRCVGDATLRPMNNTHYSSFIMATNELRRSKVTNELVKRSDYHKVYVYQPFMAKKAHDLITKGTRIYIEGKLNYRKLEGQFFSNIVAEKMIFISGANQGFNADGDVMGDIDEADETFFQEEEDTPAEKFEQSH